MTSHMTSHMTTPGDDKDDDDKVIVLENDELKDDETNDVTSKSTQSADNILDLCKCCEVFSSEDKTLCCFCGHRKCDNDDDGCSSEINDPQSESCTQEEEMTDDAERKDLSKCHCLLKYCPTTSETTDGSDSVKGSSASGKQQRRVHWKDQPEVAGGESGKEIETMENRSEVEVESRSEVEEEEERERERREAVTATSLSQLPHHFRR